MADIVNFSTQDLDFDSIVQNLRHFMRYQDEFTDYDFTGSALSTLINVLAYNTHYNGVYDNFAINESFLDSAVKRSSVVSHANLVNYIPRSAKAATATVNITVYDDDIETFNTSSDFKLSPSDVFTTSIDGVQYSFVPDSEYSFIVDQSRTEYTIEGVKLKQGTPIKTTQRYSGNSTQKFKLSSYNVDTDTIEVRVKLGGAAPVPFERADELIDIDNTSKVYFLTMDIDGYYQIQFGSGMMGYALSAQDEIIISYMVTDGSAANHARMFSFSGTPKSLGFSSKATMSVVCVGKSVGGSEPEDIESIRLLAPKMYSTQNRCVTEADYQNIIKSMYSNVKSVKVWGGEKNNPPQYGKVFISVIPKDGDLLSNAEKEIVYNIVDKRRVIGCGSVEIVDPSIINIHITSTVYYNPTKTLDTVNDIESKVREAILTYSDTYLGDFNSVMKFSHLSRAIDDCDNNVAVQNNNTRLKISSTITPEYNVLVGYTLNLNNAIYRPKIASESVISTGFYCTAVKNYVCYIDDEPQTGVLRLFYIDETSRKVVVQSVGNVDYYNGTITIDKLNITSLEGGEWRFTFDPASNDVVTKQNQFAIISSQDLIVNAVGVASDSSYVQVSSK